MKVYKAFLICSLTICLVMSADAANPAEADRPERVRAENWIKISETAGIVVGKRSADQVVGTIYVKQGDKWLEVSVENSPRAVE
jgi:hypothetical protein